MAYTVLARRYRSQRFDAVVGQRGVAQTLINAIKSGRVAHAYLFTGTRGVGKTSMARLFARRPDVVTAAADLGEQCAFELALIAPQLPPFDVPDGQIMIPCLDSLAEVLGYVPAAYWASDKGLFCLTPKRRWESLEADSGPKVASIRKN